MLDDPARLVAQCRAMIHHIVMLQPIGGSAEVPSVPTSVPGGEVPTGQPIPTAPVGDGGALIPPGTGPGPGAASGATQELCEKANSEATLATLGYGLGAGFLALVIFIVLEKKLVSSPGVRMLLGLSIGSLGAATMAYFDPARGDQFLMCLNDPTNAVYLTLGTQPVARALALGFAPALLFTFLLCFVARRVFRF